MKSDLRNTVADKALKHAELALDALGPETSISQRCNTITTAVRAITAHDTAAQAAAALSVPPEHKGAESPG